MLPAASRSSGTDWRPCASRTRWLSTRTAAASSWRPESEKGYRWFCHEGWAGGRRELGVPAAAVATRGVAPQRRYGSRRPGRVRWLGALGGTAVLRRHPEGDAAPQAQLGTTARLVDLALATRPSRG